MNGVVEDVREEVTDDEVDDEVRHIARVKTPSPKPGVRVKALCGKFFVIRSGVIVGLPPNVCQICVWLSNR